MSPALIPFGLGVSVSLVGVGGFISFSILLVILALNDGYVFVVGGCLATLDSGNSETYSQRFRTPILTQRYGSEAAAVFGCGRMISDIF